MKRSLTQIGLALMTQIKEVAMKIAAMLPSEQEKVEQILGLVEDLIEWRGYSSEPSPFDVGSSPSAKADSLKGRDDVSPQ